MKSSGRPGSSEHPGNDQQVEGKAISRPPGHWALPYACWGYSVPAGPCSAPVMLFCLQLCSSMELTGAPLLDPEINEKLAQICTWLFNLLEAQVRAKTFPYYR